MTNEIKAFNGYLVLLLIFSSVLWLTGVLSTVPALFPVLIELKKDAPE